MFPRGLKKPTDKGLKWWASSIRGGILKFLFSLKALTAQFLMIAHRRIPARARNQKLAKKNFAIFFLPFAFCCLLFSCAGWRGGSKLVQPIDENGVQQLIKQAAGKVVLLNFWATWCEPCKEEFPDLVKIAREFQPRGLEVIFVSIDEPEDIDAKVLPFLKTQGVGFRTYIKRAKDDEAFINAIDAKWSGALPATFIYDANGTLVKRLVAQQSFETFAAALQPLLPNSPSH
jgi:thiol-disulfide isomerase/thioredoxin